MKKKRVYTKKMHKYRVGLMLKNGISALDQCPAGKRFSTWFSDRCELWANNPCKICQACANITYCCPCEAIGQKESIRRLNNENLQRKV